MTYGLAVTFGAASTGLVVALLNWTQLRALPTRTDPAYDDNVKGRALGHRMVMATGLALPFIAYGAFRLIDPALFGTELF